MSKSNTTVPAPKPMQTIHIVDAVLVADLMAAARKRGLGELPIGTTAGIAIREWVKNTK